MMNSIAEVRGGAEMEIGASVLVLGTVILLTGSAWVALRPAKRSIRAMLDDSRPCATRSRS